VHLIGAVVGGCGRRQQYWRAQAHAECHREVPALGLRSLPHRVQVPGDQPEGEGALVQQVHAVEGHVALALELGDGHRRGDVAALVPREVLGYGQRGQIELLPDIVHERGVPHLLRRSGVGHGLQHHGDELFFLDLHGLGDPLPGGPQVTGCTHAMELREQDRAGLVFHQYPGDLEVQGNVLIDLDHVPHLC